MVANNKKKKTKKEKEAEEAAHKLIDQGRNKGFVTYSQILKYFPQVEQDVEGAEKIYQMLEDKGVKVKDSSDLLTEELPQKASSQEVDLVQKYLKEIGKYPLLTPQEEKKLAKMIEKGDTEARRKLIRSNLRLTISIAKKYASKTHKLGLLDLIQEGNIGLFKAAEKYNWRKGFRFSTYATWWIRQSINRALADQARTIRLPVHIVEALQGYNKAKRYLLQELGREPLPEELAAETGEAIKKIKKLEQSSQSVVSLEQPIGEEENTTLLELVEDKTIQNPENQASLSFLKSQLMEIISSLTPREQEILKTRFGVEDGVPHTLEEVGKKFDVTRERIRQIQVRALSKLKENKKIREMRK